jgi:hypothetical protein
LDNFTLLREEDQDGQPVQPENVATFDARVPFAAAGGKYPCAGCGKTIIRMAGAPLICQECLSTTSLAGAD